jgi:hypothetical protein
MNPGLTLLLVFGIGVPALRILIETPRDTGFYLSISSFVSVGPAGETDALCYENYFARAACPE